MTEKRKARKLKFNGPKLAITRTEATQPVPLVTINRGKQYGPRLQVPHNSNVKQQLEPDQLQKPNPEDKDIPAEEDKPAIKFTNHGAYQEFLNEYDIYDNYNYDIYHHHNYDSYKKLQGQDFRLISNDNINVNYVLILFLAAILIGLCLLVVLFCFSACVSTIISYIMYNPAVNRTSSKKMEKVKENDDDILQS